MPIDSHEIDPDIARRLREQEDALLRDPSSSQSGQTAAAEGGAAAEIGAVFTVEGTPAAPTVPAVAPLSPEQAEAADRASEVLRRHGAKRGTPLGEKVFTFLIGAGITAGGYFAAPHLGGAAHTLVPLSCYGFGGLIALAGVVTDLRRRRRNAAAAGGSVSYPSDVLAALLSVLTLSPVERRYGDLLVVLARDKSPLEEDARRGFLTQINGLLQDHRALARHREEVLALIDEEGMAAMRAEHSRLLREAETSDDPVVADTKRQSAEMIESRIADAREVRRIAGRMEAQEEAIYETLGTLHSSLTRLYLAPAGLGSGHASVETLRGTLEQVSGQTRAVEQAVQEVLSLQTGG